MILQVVVALLVLGVIWFVKKCTRHYGVLERMGIPMNKPFLCFGSGPWDLHNMAASVFDIEMVKKFAPSKTWGIYEGATPAVYTIDLDIIREVFVKKFDHFSERMDFPLKEEFQ